MFVICIATTCAKKYIWKERKKKKKNGKKEKS